MYDIVRVILKNDHILMKKYLNFVLDQF